MRLTLTSTLAAAALAFPQLAPSYARATGPGSVGRLSGRNPRRQGGGEWCTLPLSAGEGPRRSCGVAARMGFDLVYVAICDAATRRTRIHGSRA
jgi:hypothetical protein